MTDAILLNDEQIRRFIVDGYLTLDCGVDRAMHDEVAAELAFSGRHEFPMGDNLLARFPQVQQVVDSPVVQGAMVSLLGPEFAWSPHRAIHNSEPIEGSFEDFDPFTNGPEMGKGSLSGSGWHQDGHSKAGRVRWLECRAINVFYFPQDTPAEMGPTRILAGTHLYPNLMAVDRSQAALAGNPVSAGTVVVAHFDLGHAGTPNFAQRSRFMLKFVGLRQTNPTGPSWDHHDPTWALPDGVLTPDRVTDAWVSLWNWLRGASRTAGLTAAVDDDGSREQNELIAALRGDRNEVVDAAQVLAARGHAGADAVAALLSAMKSPHQDQRLSCMYALAALGAATAPALVESLLGHAGLDRHVSPEPKSREFHGYPEDPLARYFSNRQMVVQDETHVLVAMGEPAIAAVVPLLDHDDPWIRMNAIYAVGACGAGDQSLADLLGEALDDEDHAVVRTALDALCTLPAFGSSTVERLHRLLAEELPHFVEPIMGHHWTALHQIRFVATWALLARVTAGDPPEGVEAALITALDDPTGYVPAVATDALLRLGSASGLTAAVTHLQRTRYDHTHHEGLKPLLAFLRS